MSGFDPRRHSAVAFSISQRPSLFQGTSGLDVPLKSYLVGPNKPDPTGVNSLRRPMTAPVASPFEISGPKTKNGDAHPKFLSPTGKWVQEEIPSLIAESQAQPLSATGALKAVLPGQYGREKSLRPLTTVHTYNDISPVSTAAHVHEGDASDPVETLKLPVAQYSTNPLKTEDLSATAKAKSIGSSEARLESIGTFWNRLNGSYNLKIKDLDRSEELGRNIVAGAPNCRLVGGRWRYIPRPVEGDSIYTDYYGRSGEDPCSYYGRRYDVQTNDFSQSRLVDEGDYLKVGASMPGVHALRTRPGLTLDSTVISGASSQLEKLSPYAVRTARGVHKLPAFARMRASTPWN
jgi:hypothetical protein